MVDLVTLENDLQKAKDRLVPAEEALRAAERQGNLAAHKKAKALVDNINQEISSIINEMKSVLRSS